MDRFDFVVFGNCATVQMLKFKQMPVVGVTDTAINPRADEIFYGGCAFNVFYALARLGAKVFPAMTYADIRFKDKIYEICDEYGLPSYAVTGPPTRSYSTCLMLEDAERNHITIMYRFGEDSDRDTGERYPIEIKSEYFERSKMAVMVMGTPTTGFKIVEEVKKSGIPLAFSYRNDPVLLPKELLAEILPQTEVLFTNETEAEYLTGLFGMKRITDLFETGLAKVIVTTLGKRGCVVYEKKRVGAFASTVVPVTETPVGNVDAVGAGDGFVAGFLYGYAKGKPACVCAQYGSTVSSFVIERIGSTTNLPTLEQMLERNRQRLDAEEE